MSTELYNRHTKLPFNEYLSLSNILKENLIEQRIMTFTFLLLGFPIFSLKDKNVGKLYGFVLSGLRIKKFRVSGR